MTLMQIAKPAGGAAAVALLGLAVLSVTSPRIHADSSNTDSEVQIGFAIAPVKLNLTGKDPALVGKGSYIVNAKGDCTGCHNSPDIGPVFAMGGNPYFGQLPAVVNPKSYLGGGTKFGPIPGSGPGGVGPLIVYSRNLTPDVTGMPEGGHTFQEFLTIMRTGKDFDHAHPACPTLGVDGCIASPPSDGDVLQVMPWPIFHNMSDNDLLAVYTYLSAIPCISHGPVGSVPGLPANIYQTCPVP
jgi:hypothetical protein